MKEFNLNKGVKKFLLVLFMTLGTSVLNAQVTETISHESPSLACDGCLSVRMTICYEGGKTGLSSCIVSDTREIDSGESETFTLIPPGGSTVTLMQFQFIVGGIVVAFYDIGSGGGFFEDGTPICPGASCVDGDILVFTDSGSNTLFRVDGF